MRAEMMRITAPRHRMHDQQNPIYIADCVQAFFARDQENKARLQFFQEKLEPQADEGTALRYLQEKYEAFLTGVLTEEMPPEEDGDRPGPVES